MMHSSGALPEGETKIWLVNFMAHNSYGDFADQKRPGNPAIDRGLAVSDRINATGTRNGSEADLAWETDLFSATSGTTFGLDGRKKPDPQTSLEMFEQEISTWDQPPKSS